MTILNMQKALDEQLDKRTYPIKVSVTSGYTVQVFIAVFFPFAKNADTVSQPVNAYQNRRPLHVFCPRF